MNTTQSEFASDFGAGSNNVAIVTVTYNAIRDLDDFFNCCNSQKNNYELYCIDNLSTDGSKLKLEEIQDNRTHLTFNNTNSGVATGNNQGICNAMDRGCEWVLLLNNDTIFGSELIINLIDFANKNNLKVAVPKILYAKPSNYIWYGGGHFKMSRAFTGIHEHMDELDTGQCNTPKLVTYAPTCCMLIHRSVFEQVGLMDQSYFAYYDDTDFCLRLKKEKISIGYDPSCILIHKVGQSTGGAGSEFSVYHMVRNRLYYIRKHFGILAVFFWYPFFSIYYRIIYGIMKKNHRLYAACTKGLKDFWSMHPDTPNYPSIGS